MIMEEYNKLVAERARLQARLEDTKEQVDCFELDEDDYRDQFEEYLDEEGQIDIHTESYWPSDILRRAGDFDTAFSYWLDEQDIEDDPYYQELVGDIEALTEAIQELDEEIEELECEDADSNLCATSIPRSKVATILAGGPF